jgi:NAD(P)-dependent dehydrogenase (short-subunit alcohol dehydrogenase family)
MVIIGASGGIGQSLITAFRGRHRIIGTYCSNPSGQHYPDVDYVELDLRDRPAVKTFCSAIAGTLERPVLIYTPGVSLNNVTHKYTDEDWDETLDINLTGAFQVCRELLPRMREIGFGRIILLSSVLGRTAVPGSVAYSVTKAGLGALARVIAAENAKKGITANALALGYYNVGIISAVPKPYLEHEVIPRIPMGRLGDPSNIHAAVEFLIGADYVTGATLDMNGGIVGS